MAWTRFSRPWLRVHLLCGVGFEMVHFQWYAQYDYVVLWKWNSWNNSSMQVPISGLSFLISRMAIFVWNNMVSRTPWEAFFLTIANLFCRFIKCSFAMHRCNHCIFNAFFFSLYWGCSKTERTNSFNYDLILSVCYFDSSAAAVSMKWSQFSNDCHLPTIEFFSWRITDVFKKLWRLW